MSCTEVLTKRIEKEWFMLFCIFSFFLFWWEWGKLASWMQLWRTTYHHRWKTWSKTKCFLALFPLVDARKSTENRLRLCFLFQCLPFHLEKKKKTVWYHILNCVTNILITETCVTNKRLSSSWMGIESCTWKIWCSIIPLI